MNGRSEAGVHAVRSEQGCGWFAVGLGLREFGREAERKTGLVFAGIPFEGEFL